MRALFWKEIRQNLVWALLLAAGLGAALAWAISHTDPSRYRADTDRLPCGESFLLVTTFGCPVVAFLLALLQTVPETSADRWALLIHRPLARAGIFWSKVMAGLALYLAVAGTPFLLASWWTAVPGHVAAPFVPAMLIPGACDVVTGVAYYFAALLFFLRPARWFGTKLLPLLVPVSLSMLARSYMAPAPVVVVDLLLVGFLAAAARRAFLDYRLDRPAGPGSRLIVATLFVPGLLLLVSYGEDLVGSLVSWANQREQFGDMPIVTADGTPGLIRAYFVGGREIRGEWRDRNGNLPADGPKPIPKRLSMENFWDLPDGLTPVGYRNPAHYVEADNATLNAAQGPKWYHVPSRSRYEGFSRRDRKPVGTLDARGFLPPGTPSGSDTEIPLSPILWGGPQCLLYHGGLFFLDPRNETATPVRKGLPAGALRGALVFRLGAASQFEGDGLATCLLFFRDRIEVVGLDGKTLATLPRSAPPRPAPVAMIDVGAVAEGNGWQWIVLEQSYPFWQEGNGTALYSRYDADGHLAERIALPLLSTENAPAGRYAAAAGKAFTAAFLSPVHVVSRHFEKPTSVLRLENKTAPWEDAVSLIATVVALLLAWGQTGAGFSLPLRCAALLLVVAYGPMWVPALVLASRKKAGPLATPPRAREMREIFS